MGDPQNHTFQYYNCLILDDLGVPPFRKRQYIIIIIIHHFHDHHHHHQYTTII